MKQSVGITSSLPIAIGTEQTPTRRATSADDIRIKPGRVSLCLLRPTKRLA